MKERMSFVANSSSSSFILGVDVNKNVATHVLEKLADITVIQHPYAEWSSVKEYTPEQIAYYLMGRLKSAYIEWDSFDKLLNKGTVRDFITITDRETEQKFQMYGATSEIIHSIVSEVECQFHSDLSKAKYSLPTEQQPQNWEEHENFDIKFFTSRKKYFVDALTEFKTIYKDKRVYMGEIEDCTSFESGIEHNQDLWNILLPNMRFSHH